MTTPRGRQQGVTLVEMMVSVALVGIACAFVFGIELRSSTALRDQATIAEVQQTLRSASDLIIRDVRMSGYLARTIYRAGMTDPLRPLSVINGGANGTDELTVIYGDASTTAVILKTVNDSNTYSYNDVGTVVDSAASYAQGDLVLASHTAQSNVEDVLGVACLLQVTGVDPTHIITGPAVGGPWNQTGNSHCDAKMSSIWNDGYTVFAKAVYRTYRIKPDDPRGVLQMSPSGTVVANDWQDLALGVVDLQVALRVHQSGGTDLDGDGEANDDWYSGENLEAIPSGAQITEAAITLLAKSTSDVAGAVATATPSLFEAGKPADYNRIGDVSSTALPVTDMTSRYYGQNVYRTFTRTVELRNAVVNQ